MRASASLPYASRIVEAGGKSCWTAAALTASPVRAFQRLGYGRNVVVLTRPEGYVKKPERRGLARVFYRRYPAFVKALSPGRKRITVLCGRSGKWSGPGRSL